MDGQASLCIKQMVYLQEFFDYVTKWARQSCLEDLFSTT